MRQCGIRYSRSLTLVMPIFVHVSDPTLQVDAIHAGHQTAKDRLAACSGDSA